MWRNLLSSLRFRILAGNLALILLMFGLITANTLRVVNELAVETIQTTARQTSETLNLAIAPYTTSENLGTLQDYFQELVSGGEKGIVYLALLDEQQHILVATPTTPHPLPELHLNLQQQLEQGVVHTQQPILLLGNRVGTLRYGLSATLLKEADARILRENLLFLAGAMVVVIVLLIGVGIWLNQRINRLMQASQALASGDYATRAPEHGNDELNRLAHDFNRMAEAVEERIAALERSRAEIQKLNQSLETRVVERTRELAERNTQLAEAISHLHETQEYLVRSEKLAGLGMIVAAVAHELNSPIGNALTVATAFTEKTRTFQKEAAEGLRRSVLQTYVQDAGIAAELIERNIDRAAELIRSFKQVTVDQTSSQRRSFNLRQTLEELAATLRPTFKKNGYQLLLNIPANIDLDSYPGPLGQVISNFVTNALLHAFEGRRGGTMRLSCTPCGEDRIELLFEDDGKGIPAEHLPRIFDPFFTTRLGTGGSGLGLNIVHNIVTGLLGGEISVESTPGQGTRFRILIPRQAPTTATAESSVAYANRMDTSPAPDNHVK